MALCLEKTSIVPSELTPGQQPEVSIVPAETFLFPEKLSISVFFFWLTSGCFFYLHVTIQKSPLFFFLKKKKKILGHGMEETFKSPPKRCQTRFYKG